MTMIEFINSHAIPITIGFTFLNGIWSGVAISQGRWGWPAVLAAITVMSVFANT